MDFLQAFLKGFFTSELKRANRLAIPFGIFLLGLSLLTTQVDSISISVLSACAFGVIFSSGELLHWWPKFKK